MKVMLVGGGTGGHITPLLAVAHELKKLSPESKIIYLGEKGGKFSHLTENHALLDGRVFINAGKFRRYHNENLIRRLTDIKTIFLNLRDLIRFLIGFFEAFWILLKSRPQIIFIKGGFVAVPVGLAAVALRIPFITHDSDTMPGLANRIIGRWAKWHTTGMPNEFYNYKQDTVRYVGIPLAAEYVFVDEDLKLKYKKELGIPEKSKVLFITGGSLGAQKLNQYTVMAVADLLEKFSDLYVLHQTGNSNEDLYAGLDSANKHIKAFAFSDEMYLYSGAADVVVARAGATTVAELAVQGKAVIIVPNPYLSGGHQLKNAKHLQDEGAVLVVDESSLFQNSEVLQKNIEDLLNNDQLRLQLSDRLHSMAKPTAASDIAKLLTEMAS